jgi:hypothetical protein
LKIKKVNKKFQTQLTTVTATTSRESPPFRPRRTSLPPQNLTLPSTLAENSSAAGGVSAETQSMYQCREIT